MTIKILGALLLLFAGGSVSLCWVAGQRKELRRLLALASALERMEGVIRWQMLPLPRVLQQEGSHEISGSYMEQVRELLQSGMPLHIAWRNVFGDISPGEAGEILCRMELSGDTVQVTGALHLAAQQLRQLAEQRGKQQGEKERVCLALGASMTGLLVILLM